MSLYRNMAIATISGFGGSQFCHLVGFKGSISTIVGIFMTVLILTNLSLKTGVKTDKNDGLQVPEKFKKF